MSIILKNPFSLFVHLPGLTFHAEQILISLVAVAATMILMLIAILKTDWNKRGKTLLLSTYFGSIVITGIYFNSWPIFELQAIITVCLILFPIIVVSLNYFLFRKYFRIKK